jgi:hypothetical protein
MRFQEMILVLLDRSDIATPEQVRFLIKKRDFMSNFFYFLVLELVVFPRSASHL